MTSTYLTPKSWFVTLESLLLVLVNLADLYLFFIGCVHWPARVRVQSSNRSETLHEPFTLPRSRGLQFSYIICFGLFWEIALERWGCCCPVFIFEANLNSWLKLVNISSIVKFAETSQKFDALIYWPKFLNLVNRNYITVRSALMGQPFIIIAITWICNICKLSLQMQPVADVGSERNCANWSGAKVKQMLDRRCWKIRSEWWTMHLICLQTSQVQAPVIIVCLFWNFNEKIRLCVAASFWWSTL